MCLVHHRADTEPVLAQLGDEFVQAQRAVPVLACPSAALVVGRHGCPGRHEEVPTAGIAGDAVGLEVADPQSGKGLLEGTACLIH